MKLADYYQDIIIGAEAPEIVRLADALVLLSNTRSELVLGDDPRDRSIKGRYCSMSVATEVQFFSCDLQFDPQAYWQSQMPAGIWVGTIFSGDWTTRLEGVDIRFPANGLPQLISIGQASRFTDRPMSNKRLRMASFLIGQGFFDQVADDDPTDHLSGLKAMLRPGVHVLPLGPNQVLTQNLTNLLNNPYCGATERLYVESIVMASIFELANHLSDNSPSRDNDHHANLALEARDQINHAPEKFESISALAAKLGTNETTLRREFKSIIGVTIFEYVLNCRMQAARVLVRDRHLQISEIAYLIGYSSPSNFTAAYKKFFGCTPVDERR